MNEKTIDQCELKKESNIGLDDVTVEAKVEPINYLSNECDSKEEINRGEVVTVKAIVSGGCEVKGEVYRGEEVTVEATVENINSLSIYEVKNQSTSKDSKEFTLTDINDGSKFKVLKAIRKEGSLNIKTCLPETETFLKSRTKLAPAKALVERMRLFQKECEFHKFTILQEEEIVFDLDADGFKVNIGKGAMGNVYSGIIAFTGKKVAIKEMDITHIFNNQPITLLREINASINIEHERIPKFHGVFFSQKKFVNLVYDLLEGQNLLEIYKNLSNNIKLNLMVQLVSIVHSLHRLNSVHRDIKPHNIIVDKNFKLFIVDLGCFKLLSSAGASKTSDMKGTYVYMPPENTKIDEDDIDNPIKVTLAFDIWSTGCIISEIFSGVIPWSNHSSQPKKSASIIILLEHNTPFPIPENIPEEIKEVILKCLEYDQEKRISSKDLLDYLINLEEKNIIK